MEYLRQVPTFSKFSDEKLEKVFANLDLQDWSKGEIIFRKGEVRIIYNEHSTRGPTSEPARRSRCSIMRREIMPVPGRPEMRST